MVCVCRQCRMRLETVRQHQYSIGVLPMAYPRGASFKSKRPCLYPVTDATGRTYKYRTPDARRSYLLRRSQRVDTTQQSPSPNMKSVAVFLCFYLIQAQAYPDVSNNYWVGDMTEEDDRLTSELDELLLGQERDDSYDVSVKREPGKTVHKCSTYRYGCCPDRNTEALTADKFDCGPKLCIDVKVAYCQTLDRKKKLDCDNKIHKDMCAHTCGNCKKPASPLDECRKMRHRFGCCWDGTAAVGPRGRGCRRCGDLNPFTCKQFANVSPKGCNSASWGIRSFLETRCAKTCGVCNYSYEKK